MQAFLETDKGALEDVDAVLKASEDEDDDLWPLLQSPLMLNVISVASHRAPEPDLRRLPEGVSGARRVSGADTRLADLADLAGPDPDGTW